MVAAMRVAIVTTSYPAFPGDPSGHFVETEARLLSKDGEVVIVTPGAPGPGAVAPRLQPGEVTVWRVPAGDAFGWPGAEARVRQRPSRMLSIALWTKRARAALRRVGRLDRVIAHWVVPSAFPVSVGLTRAHGPRLELVSHGADVRALARLPGPCRHAVVAAMLAEASEWRFASRSLEEELLATLRPEDAAAVARVASVRAPPIDLPDVRWRSEALRRARGSGPLLVCVGRLVTTKRFDRALDRAATWSGARVVVVGDGPERERLEAHARMRRVDARFVGMTRREEALAWIGAADALLHASSAEGLSTVVREAEALGVHVEVV
jgi:glycosyltransferase involved in cell wall biosynthesis